MNLLVHFENFQNITRLAISKLNRQFWTGRRIACVFFVINSLWQPLPIHAKHLNLFWKPKDKIKKIKARGALFKWSPGSGQIPPWRRCDATHDVKDASLPYKVISKRSIRRDARCILSPAVLRQKSLRQTSVLSLRSLNQHDGDVLENSV